MILLCQNPSVNVASDRGVSLNLALLQIQLWLLFLIMIPGCFN
jgi:hypothetical protein